MNDTLILELSSCPFIVYWLHNDCLGRALRRLIAYCVPIDCQVIAHSVSIDWYTHRIDCLLTAHVYCYGYTYIHIYVWREREREKRCRHILLPTALCLCSSCSSGYYTCSTKLMSPPKLPPSLTLPSSPERWYGPFAVTHFRTASSVTAPMHPGSPERDISLFRSRTPFPGPLQITNPPYQISLQMTSPTICFAQITGESLTPSIHMISQSAI